MKEEIYNIICQLDNERKEKKIKPDGVMYNDVTSAVLKQMRKELNALQKEGYIKAHPTINSVIIEKLK